MPKLKQAVKKLLLSDFDGTMYNSLKINYAAFKEVFDHFGVAAPTIEEFQMSITRLMDNFYYNYGVPKTVSLEEIHKIRHNHKSRIYYQSHILPDIVEAFQKIKGMGVSVAVVSSNTFDDISKIIYGNKELKQIISAIFAGDKNLLLKQAMDKFEVSANETVYIDDTVEGLTAAKNLGIFTVAVGYEGGFQPVEQLKKIADCAIKSPLELPLVLRLK